MADVTPITGSFHGVNLKVYANQAAFDADNVGNETPASAYRYLAFVAGAPQIIDDSGDLFKIVTADANSNNVALTGTLIISGGDVTVSAGDAIVDRTGDAANAFLALAGDAGVNSRGLRILTGANRRWEFIADSTAESGSDAGSNFRLNAFTDAGVFIDSAMQITRLSGGWITFNRTVNLKANIDHDGTQIGFNGNTPVTRQTYGAPTGTATRTTFVTSTVTLPQLAERVKAMIDDFRSRGDFG